MKYQNCYIVTQLLKHTKSAKKESLSFSSQAPLSEDSEIVPWSPGVNFINILHAAFTLVDPKSIKKIDNLTVIFTILGSSQRKAVHKMLMKLTPEAHHQQHSALAFVQHALAKEEEYDIAPLATLTTSVARRTTTQPRITTTKTTTSTTTRTTTSYSPPMIPDSYTVPDEEYTKRTFDRFIFMLKQVSKI